MGKLKMVHIQRPLSSEKEMNIKKKIFEELQRNKQLHALPKGAKIAITAGSRGIANIVTILREVVTVLRNLSYIPFIVPAMGSHGGATASGQLEVLRRLGITETSVGAEIHSSMEVEKIAYTSEGIPVYMDRHAYKADGIIVINRIKPHTAFTGPIQSGLSKMVAIGLGKIQGATYLHNRGSVQMADNIIHVCKSALIHAPIVMGLALIENGYDETAKIVGVSVEKWFQTEEKLLKQAQKLMPTLPINSLDLLIVEEMGKTYSGTGMDPNVIGRWRIEGVPEPAKPNIKRLAVLDLANESYGNAQGIGLADFTTEKLIHKIDRKSTYTNALASTFLRRVMLPLFFKTEKEVVETAITSIGPTANIDKLKIIQIPNTLQLDQLYVSPEVIKEMDSMQISYTEKEVFTVAFNDEGELVHRLCDKRSRI